MKKIPKILRITIWTLLALGGLIALAWSIENWRGARAWAKCQDRLTKEGITLSFSKLAPEPIADADNFWMTPVLAGTELADGEEARERIEWIQKDLLAHVDPDQIKASWPKDSSARRADLSVWTDPFGGEVEGLAGGVEKMFGAELRELAEAAKRPGARLKSDWAKIDGADFGALAAIQFPHFKTTMTLNRVLTLRALVALESGDADGAVDAIRAQSRLAEAVSGDPMLISHLVMVALRNQARGVIWEGLARQAWSREQLLELKTELERIDSIENLARIAQGELTFQMSAFEFLQKASSSEFKGFADLGDEGLGYPRWIPSGWIDQNKVFCVNWMLDGVILPARKRDWPGLASRVEIPENPEHPYHSFAMLMIPALDRIRDKTAVEFMRTRLALAACDAELHRLEHGAYPESSPAGYEDFDGQQLRYRLGENGRPEIYSIGWNFADDGGELGSEDKSRQGDWVWKY